MQQLLENFGERFHGGLCVPRVYPNAVILPILAFLASLKVSKLRAINGPYGFESEPVGLDLDSLQHFSPEHLVARLHVRQFQICENVRKQRQQAVRHVMPEVVHALRPAQKS